MRLHVHEWGDPAAPPLVCVHGVTAHGERFKRLAETRWAEHFHVVAPDLRGHGRSEHDAPWTFATYVADLLETLDGLGIESADWVGHSFGGRLVLEVAARHPERIRRAVLLDPAIQVLPHVAAFAADGERGEPVFDSFDAYADAREDSPPREHVLEDAALHLEPLPDGRLRRRTYQAAMVSIYGELASEPPPAETLQVPTLLIHAPAYGLVREEQLAAYAHVEQLAVPGMHMVMWDAFDEVADAVLRFLNADSATRELENSRPEG
jgi:lipase